MTLNKFVMDGAICMLAAVFFNIRADTRSGPLALDRSCKAKYYNSKCSTSSEVQNILSMLIHLA